MDTQAKLIFSPSSYTLTGGRDTTQSGVFKVTNDSTIDFVCRSITASCGCTTPTGIATGTIIKPGESVDLEFFINLKSPGTKYVYIFGNAETITLPISLQLT
jgi:hypothetical protein